MNQKIVCITLDLEPDHAGRLPEQYEGWKMENIKDLFRILKKHRIPLSVFVVARAIKKHQDVIRYMQREGAEFYLHSYSHSLRQPDSEEEIRKGTVEFRKFFGRHPMGYRAPEGRITDDGYRSLSRYGFRFDSSVFPSIWPHPKYMFRKRIPHTGPFGIAEIPLTCVGPAGIIFSFSFIKLIGWEAFRSIIRIFPLPDTVVFDFHLHDVFMLPGRVSLSPFWRLVYRKKTGNDIQLLNQIFRYLSEQGYSFVPIQTLIQEI